MARAEAHRSRRRAPALVSAHQLDGHEASIADRTWSDGLSLASQAVISFQKEPAPTGPGIRSDASNRKVYSSLARISLASWSIGDCRSEVSRPLFAETQPALETFA
jgi:hypothetical protein